MPQTVDIINKSIFNESCFHRVFGMCIFSFSRPILSGGYCMINVHLTSALWAYYMYALLIYLHEQTSAYNMLSLEFLRLHICSCSWILSSIRWWIASNLLGPEFWISATWTSLWFWMSSTRKWKNWKKKCWSTNGAIYKEYVPQCMDIISSHVIFFNEIAPVLAGSKRGVLWWGE